jgi:hypothetical protein
LQSTENGSRGGKGRFSVNCSIQSANDRREIITFSKMTYQPVGFLAHTIKPSEIITIAGNGVHPVRGVTHIPKCLRFGLGASVSGIVRPHNTSH